MKLVSVIVPIYNQELYIQTCVQSIRNQTYSNLEIILVDDGSIDESGSICESYTKEDKRIKVIHQKNGGDCRLLEMQDLLLRAENMYVLLTVMTGSMHVV